MQQTNFSGRDIVNNLDRILVRTRLFGLRQATGLPQWKIALASGVKDSRLSKLENGLPPTAMDINRLTAFYEVSASEIWPDIESEVR